MALPPTLVIAFTAVFSLIGRDMDAAARDNDGMLGTMWHRCSGLLRHSYIAVAAHAVPDVDYNRSRLLGRLL